MTPDTAGELFRRARKLARRGFITPAMLLLYDAMLWGARRPGAWEIDDKSYRDLANIAGVGRSLVAEALPRFELLGLLRKQRRRIRFTWRGICVAARQALNLYDFRPVVPGAESGKRPASHSAVFKTVEIDPLGRIPWGDAVVAIEGLRMARQSRVCVDQVG